MRFAGTHRSTYTYSAPVSLESHTIRLRPRSGPGQIVRSFEIDIDPKPDGVSGGMDAWGNDVLWAWFSGKHERLEITTNFIVDRLRVNPFDFVVPPDADRMPPIYAEDELAGLIPYLVVDEREPAVEALAREASTSGGGDLVGFLGELVRRIHEGCRTIVRPTGEPFAAAQTLAAGEGSCRDLAVLFVEACRHVGVAARFVSGYVADRPEGQARELHAWAGVYVPGGGWRGYDPTQGLACSTGHVRLAAAATPAGAAPVTGRFSAEGGATSDFAFDISFETSATPDGRT